MGKEAKLLLQFHKASSTTKLVIFGLYQYHKNGMPINEIQKALQIIETYFKIFSMPLFIKSIDLALDTILPILTLKKNTYTRWANNNFKGSLKIFKNDTEITGITKGKKSSRFKLTAYSKSLKNGIKVPINRIELTIKEKYNKSIPIINMLELDSYINLIKNEFNEVLNNKFEPYIYIEPKILIIAA